MWTVVLPALAVVVSGPLSVTRPASSRTIGATLRVWTDGNPPLTGTLVRVTPAALTLGIENRDVELARGTIKRVDLRERRVSRRTRVLTGIGLGLAGSLIIRPKSTAVRNRILIALPVGFGTTAALLPTAPWRTDVPLEELFGPARLALPPPEASALQ